MAENAKHVAAREQLILDARLTLTQVEDRYKQVSSLMFVNWPAVNFLYRRIKPSLLGLKTAVARMRNFGLQCNMCKL